MATSGKVEILHQAKSFAAASRFGASLRIFKAFDSQGAR